MTIDCLRKAEHFYLKQDFSKALEHYSKAVELIGSDQFDEDLYMGLSNCYYNMGNYKESNAELHRSLIKIPVTCLRYTIPGSIIT